MPPRRKKPVTSKRPGKTGERSRSPIASAASLPPMTNVPASRVGEVVQSFIDNGVERLRVFPDGPGTFTVLPE